MELLKEIRDSEFREDTKIRTREAVRAVIFNDKGMIPLLFVSKHSYHKLPGGGIEAGEDKMTALARETREEVGCDIEANGEVGKIIEYRAYTDDGLKQTSFCFWGKVASRIHKTKFTEDELSEGFQLVWVSLEGAISVFGGDKPTNHEGGLIQKRDLTFLKRAKQMMKTNHLMRSIASPRL